MRRSRGEAPGQVYRITSSLALTLQSVILNSPALRDTAAKTPSPAGLTSGSDEGSLLNFAALDASKVILRLLQDTLLLVREVMQEDFRKEESSG